MNWLDFVIIALLVVGALLGMRIGLIGAAFNAVGIFLGWVLAGQYSDDVGGLFSDSLPNDTLVTVISFAIIIVIAVAVANFLLKFVRPLLTVFTLGLSKMVDKLGGLALGLLIGVAFSSALILGMARVAYNFDTDLIASVVPERFAENLTQVEQQLEKVEDVKEDLVVALNESKLVSIFIDLTDAIPADALGFVPDDFKVALDFVEVGID